MQKAFSAIARGRVQMVMYRDFTSRSARRLGIVGTVRNRDDGTVEIIAEGEENALHSFIQQLHEGPMLSRVDSLDVEWGEPTRGFKGFSIQ